MIKDTGGPAFPAFEHHAGYGQMMAVGGMTLRDYFAADAMQIFMLDKNMPLTEANVGLMCKACYHVADEMLEARKA